MTRVFTLQLPTSLLVLFILQAGLVLAGEGSFIRANITVDGQGLIVSASNGAPINLSTEVTNTLGTANIADGAVTSAKINSNPASNNYVLTADGAGKAFWMPAQNGLPTGACILTESSTPPTGFTYTGSSLQTGGGGGGEQWIQRAAMLRGNAAFGTATINGKVYTVGGVGTAFFNNCDEYDPSTNTWRARAPMSTARDWVACAAVGNQLFVFGGYNGATMVATNEMYDATTNTWTVMAPMPTARSGASAAAVNGRIYIIGGDLAGVNELTANEEYDPSTNTWQARAPMPTARTAGGVAVINNQIYFVGGSKANNSQIFTNNEVYDPATNTWAVRGALPSPRHNFAIGVSAGKIYVIGGTSTGANLSSVDEYTPANNTWASKLAMPSAREYFAAGNVGDRIFGLGGYNGGFQNTNLEYSNTPATGGTFYIHRKN